MTFRTFCLVALLLVTALAQNCCDQNTIKVSGNAEVKVKPDFATIEIGAEAQASTTSEALRLLNSKIDTIIKIIEGLGISPKDYSTSSLRLNQVYEYRNNENVLIGQKATQTFSVKIRDITADGAAIGKLIDSVSSIDNIIVNGVTFDQSDRTLGLKQARKAAFEAAKKKADEYAALSGLRIRKVIRIEALGGGNIIPFFASGASFAGDFKTLVPTRDVSVSENVNVWFSLLP